MNKLMIENEQGDQLLVELAQEGHRQVGRLTIDGVRYHIERIKALDLQQWYVVDTDDSYEPQRDERGKCVVIAPYSKG